MAFTKITHAGIGSTGTVLLENLEVTGVGTFGGSVSVGGTLTYEDVTNIDSVGLITARAGVVVGSGITLSKDGDGFFTGIVTATSFSGDGTNLTNVGVDTAVVFTDKITLPDSSSGSINVGLGSDLQILHNGSDSFIQNFTGDLNIRGVDGKWIYIQAKSGENSIICKEDGSVELYHDNVKTAYTHGSGFNIKGGNTSDQTELIITGNEGQDASILMSADDGDDNADHWRMYSQASDNAFTLKNYAAGSYETSIKANGNGNVELYYDNSKKIETTSGGVSVTGGINLTTNLSLLDNGYLKLGTGDDLQLYHDGSNSYLQNSTGTLYILPKSGENGIQLVPDGAVRLYYDNSQKFATANHGVDVIGLLQVQGNCAPSANNTYDLGTTSERWRNIYTNDLNLSNEGSSNNVDGTWGNYTIQEGESDLFLINNRNGKKYKFNLTEVA